MELTKRLEEALRRLVADAEYICQSRECCNCGAQTGDAGYPRCPACNKGPNYSGRHTWDCPIRVIREELGIV